MPEMTIPAENRTCSDPRTRVLISLGNHGLAAADPVGNIDLEPIEVHFRRRVGRPLPGDCVEIDGDHAVTAIQPRNNLFGRGNRQGRFQPVAANLDSLLIVIAPEPAPSLDLLHRYIAAAHIERIRPIVVVNKTDLGIPNQPPFSQLGELGVAVLYTRCKGSNDVGDLARRLSGGVHLLAGQSGVGKSSLANALLPDLSLQTRKLSQATGKGRHTTTSARLFRLPDGGWLVDSPGVWEYGLWRMSRERLERGFPEFTKLEACRFRDCRHAREPDCAVRAAVAAGQLPESRHQAWLSLLREQERLLTGA